ncbi:30S ribosomal protein S8 [Candidatus Parcubacteria bacterium]|nr:MAG: 30S ribosomal protein S8 [Candidatus Parcubacteria bacterium]
MTDPISDMLTRIRNSQAVGKETVLVPMSKIKYEIAKILVREGYLEKVEVVKEVGKSKQNAFDNLKLYLKYNNGRPAITSLKRISKPGLRIYAKKDNLPRVLNNMGIAVLSTSRGLMTNKEARKAKVGGEVLFEIY